MATCEACLESTDFIVKDCHHRICSGCQAILEDRCVDGCRGARPRLSAAITSQISLKLNKVLLDYELSSIADLERAYRDVDLEIEYIDEKIAELLKEKSRLVEKKEKATQKFTANINELRFQTKLADYDAEAAQILASHGRDISCEEESFTIISFQDVIQQKQTRPTKLNIKDDLKLVVSKKTIYPNRVTEYSIVLSRRPDLIIVPPILTNVRWIHNFCEIIDVNEKNTCVLVDKKYRIFEHDAAVLQVTEIPKVPRKCSRLVGDTLEIVDCPSGYNRIKNSGLAYGFLYPSNEDYQSRGLLILNVFTMRKVFFAAPKHFIEVRRYAHFDLQHYQLTFISKDEIMMIDVPRKFLD